MLKDIKPEFVSRGVGQIEGNLNAKVKRRKMPSFDRDLVMSRIVGLDDHGNWREHFADCDLVIEAVLEDLALKHKVIEEMERTAGAIPLREVGKRVAREVERATIEHTLDRTEWNRKEAAAILGVSYKTLLQKIRACGVDTA